MPVLGQLAERAQHLTFAAEIEELAGEKGVIAALDNPRLDPLPQCHSSSRMGHSRDPQTPNSDFMQKHDTIQPR